MEVGEHLLIFLVERYLQFIVRIVLQRRRFNI
jgi:hypothetical protein